GRVASLRDRLPADCKPRSILDFGCGTGGTSAFLAETFPASEVVGVDTSEDALAHASAQHGSRRVHFLPIPEFGDRAEFDLCYVNGVFHHIEPKDRRAAFELIRRHLRPGGCFALFENNPWNPGTRMVMARIPFDRDAKPLSPFEARRSVSQAGFDVLQT